jgi:diapolycopene oxygenase
MSSRPQKVLVVGAGLGGLSAAITLATEGFPVEVFEKNPQIGGKLNFRTLDGFSFDLGPSIIILPHLFRRLFERAGRRMEDYVVFDELQPQWRSFFEDGTTIDLHPDVARMESELARLGRGAEGYWEFVDYSRRLFKFTEEAYLESGADTLSEVVRGRSLPAIVGGVDPMRSMAQGIDRFVSHPHLRDMLGFFIKYVGSSFYDAPAMMNLLPYSQLSHGLFYVRGGMYNLARGLGRLLHELGGTVHLDSEVVKIGHEGDRVTGLTLADGSFHAADAIVSNMEVIPAYERLLGEPDSLMMKRYRYMFEPAASGIVVHLGLNRRYPQLQHHNFFFARDVKLHLDTIHRKKKLPLDPTIYLVCPTRTDPKLAPEGHEIIKILPHIPYLQEPRFTADDYEQLKQRCFDKLERMGLELRKHVVVEDMLTPDDLERMYYSNRGAIYGVVVNRFRNWGFKAPKRSEKYRNLHFVGGSVNPGGGTPMVVLSGQHVGQRIARDFQQEPS